MQYNFKPLAIAFALITLHLSPFTFHLMAAVTFPARCVRVTADPSVGAVTAPLVVEEWQAVDGGSGQLLSRINHRKLVIAPGQQVSVSWPISNRYVRLPPAGSYLWRSPCAGGIARFGLYSASPESLSISAGGRDAASASGAPELAAPYPLPYGTSRPMGSLAADGSALDVQLSRFVAASGATVRVEWTPVSASLSEAYVPLPPGGDLPTNVTIAVTADLDGNGTYSPGEPYGACHMQLADYAAPEVCLTRYHPSIMRIDLNAAVQNPSYDAQRALCDRYVVGLPVTNAPTTGAMAQPGSVVRVRVALAAINGREHYQASQTSTILYPTVTALDRRISLSERPLIDESLLLDSGIADLGSGLLDAQASRLGMTSCLSAGWYVVLGEGTIDMSKTNNCLSVAFNNYYESTCTAATAATPPGTVFRGFPRLSWLQATIKAYAVPYPTWHLAVHSAATGGSIIYEQDFNSPCLDADGQYSATLPILPGALGSGGVEIAATNYWWSVSPIDAKFPTPDTSAPRSQFRLE